METVGKQPETTMETKGKRLKTAADSSDSMMFP